MRTISKSCASYVAFIEMQLDAHIRQDQRQPNANINANSFPLCVSQCVKFRIVCAKKDMNNWFVDIHYWLQNKWNMNNYGCQIHVRHVDWFMVRCFHFNMQIRTVDMLLEHIYTTYSFLFLLTKCRACKRWICNGVLRYNCALAKFVGIAIKRTNNCDTCCGMQCSLRNMCNNMHLYIASTRSLDANKRQ